MRVELTPEGRDRAIKAGVIAKDATVEHPATQSAGFKYSDKSGEPSALIWYDTLEGFNR